MQNPYRFDLGNEDLFLKWNFKKFCATLYALRLKRSTLSLTPDALRFVPCALLPLDGSCI